MNDARERRWWQKQEGFRQLCDRMAINDKLLELERSAGRAEAEAAAAEAAAAAAEADRLAGTALR